MLNSLKGLAAYVAASAAVLLIISLYDMYIVVGEKSSRSSLLAHGRDAQARVVRTTGLETVLIEWTDEDGKKQIAESKTGKVFARTSLGTTVPIKYDPASSRQPVILPEVAERERYDAFWLRSSLLMLAGCSAFCAAAVFPILVRRGQTGERRAQNSHG